MSISTSAGLTTEDLFAQMVPKSEHEARFAERKSQEFLVGKRKRDKT